MVTHHLHHRSQYCTPATSLTMGGMLSHGCIVACMLAAKPPMYLRQNGHAQAEEAATARSWRAQLAQRLWLQRVSSTTSGCSMQMPHIALSLLLARMSMPSPERDLTDDCKSCKLSVPISRPYTNHVNLSVSVSHKLAMAYRRRQPHAWHHAHVECTPSNRIVVGVVWACARGLCPRTPCSAIAAQTAHKAQAHAVACSWGCRRGCCCAGLHRRRRRHRLPCLSLGSLGRLRRHRVAAACAAATPAQQTAWRAAQTARAPAT